MQSTRCRSATNSAEAARPTAIVWGNCQAPPIADLLRGPLAAVGVDVLRLPPVYQVTADDLDRLRPTLGRCAAFVTQPVGEAAFGGGRGSDTIAALLPSASAVVSFPVSYWTGPFPFQVHGHGSDGERVDAAVTDYHDVRAAFAAAQGMTPEAATRWWPSAPAPVVRERAAASLAELQRREHGLDVTTSDLLTAPDALWTMTHPSNTVLAAITRRILTRLVTLEVCPADVDDLTVPTREFLGARRAPVDASVADAFDWPLDPSRDDWTIDGTRRPLVDVLRAQLAAYRERPDVVADVLRRHGALTSAW